MTTINNYSVGLSLDASSYIRNSSLSRKETASLTRQINAARSPAEKYERTVNTLDKALKEGAISQGTYNRLLAEAKNKYQGTDKAANRHLSTLKKLAVAYIGFSTLKRGVSSAVQLAAEAEQAQVAFRVLLKDEEKALDMLAELKAFSAATPFSFPEIRDAGRLLVAFGFSSREVSKQLEVMGNLAAGTNQPIGELAELIGKARVQNTIFSEDLNQLTGRGINVLDGLAAKFGVTTDKVKKLASESKITFEDLNDVLVEMATGSGTFAGLMEQQSQTLSGSFSTLKDNVASINQDIGQALLPTMKELVEVSNDFAKSVKESSQQGSIGYFSAVSGDISTFLRGRKFKGLGDMLPKSMKFLQQREKELSDFGFGGTRSQEQFDKDMERYALRNGLAMGTGDKDAKSQAMQAAIGEMADSAVTTFNGLRAAITSITGLHGKSVPETQQERIAAAIEDLRIEPKAQSRQEVLGDAISTITSGVQWLGSVITATSQEETAKIVAATSDDGIAESITVGTQEAYEFLTRQATDAVRKEREDAQRQIELQEEANAEGKKTNELLDDMLGALENNKVRRVR